MTPSELRATYRAMGLTQQALADRLGVTVRAVRFWEQGERPIPKWLALALRGIDAPKD